MWALSGGKSYRGVPNPLRSTSPLPDAAGGAAREADRVAELPQLLRGVHGLHLFCYYLNMLVCWVLLFFARPSPGPAAPRRRRVFRRVRHTARKDIVFSSTPAARRPRLVLPHRLPELTVRGAQLDLTALPRAAATLNLPTRIIPTKNCWIKTSRKFRVDSLWTWEFHPLEFRLWLSQTLRYPESYSTEIGRTSPPETRRRARLGGQPDAADGARPQAPRHAAPRGVSYCFLCSCLLLWCYVIIDYDIITMCYVCLPRGVSSEVSPCAVRGESAALWDNKLHLLMMMRTLSASLSLSLSIFFSLSLSLSIYTYMYTYMYMCYVYIYIYIYIYRQTDRQTDRHTHAFICIHIGIITSGNKYRAGDLCRRIWWICFAFFEMTTGLWRQHVTLAGVLLARGRFWQTSIGFAFKVCMQREEREWRCSRARPSSRYVLLSGTL